MGLKLVDVSSEHFNWLVDDIGWWAYGPPWLWKRAVTHYLLKPRGMIRAGVKLRRRGRDRRP